MQFSSARILTHVAIRWQPDLKEWYCIKCGRTSEHAIEHDAWIQINGFDCSPPTPKWNRPALSAVELDPPQSPH